MENEKVWFVTGASKGLGLSLIKLLLQTGYKVAATSRNAEEIGRVITADKENLLALTVDITDEGSVNSAITKTIAHFGKLDVIVNNAGYSIYGSVEVLSNEEFRKTIDVNLFGTINVIRAAMPHFRQQRSGYIFNISSVAGYKGFANSPSYAAGKFAVIGLSESLAEEIKPFGVKVTVVAPGFFRTSFLDKGDELISENAIDEYHVEALVDRLRAINGKQPGDPEKLVAALISLSKEQNPPVHLLMGPDAYQIVMQKRTAEQEEFEAWKGLTLSTDFDDELKADSQKFS
ncbi:SDR family NAD(P)-dependent oxidoreductase [Pedobacter sp. L105]|uniref:SDR family NAD(P)-dependent oxidoreductase n=1 Tax=Pedobacter sp. L105 TaxID=1641871 RepID=UPI00131D845C|nr:SDR family NAD(P)-dependent oxidoreductase [Pedobacter sp. L105]